MRSSRLIWVLLGSCASACGFKSTALVHPLADAGPASADAAAEGGEDAAIGEDAAAGPSPADAGGGLDASCPAGPVVPPAGMADPRLIFPGPRSIQTGALLAQVKSACVDTSLLASHAHLDALVPELVKKAGLAVAPAGCGCDYAIAFSAWPPRLSGEADQTLRAAGTNEERYVAITRTVDRRGSATLYAGGERAAIWALRAALAMAQVDPNARDARRVATSTIVDYPAFARRGIVEAIYGPLRYCDAASMDWLPWRVGDRKAAIDLMAELRENTFIYGPKCDPYARAQWRTPYPPGSGDESVIRVAIHEADRYLVDFVWSISPAGDYDFASPASDWGHLTAKIDGLRALGVHRFALFLDDIPDHTAATQVGLINQLDDYIHRSEPNEHLIVVGTTYCSNPGNTYNCGGPNAYTDEIGRTAHPDVEIMWTGADVEPATMSAGDMHAINGSLRRKVTIWDNWPNAPGGFGGRSADLETAVQGYYSNPVLNEYPGPANPPLVFFEALGAIADYLWLPDRYDRDPAASFDHWKQIVDRDPVAANAAPCGSYAPGWTCDPSDSHRVFFCDVTSPNQPNKALSEHWCPGGCVSKPVGTPDLCN